MAAELLPLINQFADLNILVVGDAMLDSYLHGISDRLCPEAPVPVVSVQGRVDQPGGAANTALNVSKLSGNVTLLSVIGNDSEGSLLKQSLNHHGVTVDRLLTVPDRQTLTKHRVMANNHLLLRFDQGSTDPLNSATESALIEQLTELVPQFDALIVSDYSYGILTPRIIQTLALLQARYPRVVVIDSKRLTAYRSVNPTAVKPNYTQALELLGNPEPPNDRIQYITTQGDQILNLTGAAIAAITLDTDGALIFERGQPTYRTYAQPASHIQATGAGDTYVSTLTLALAAGASTPIAAELASTAAAIVVAKQGTAVCEIEELQTAIRARSCLGTVPPKSVEDFHSWSGIATHEDSARDIA